MEQKKRTKFYLYFVVASVNVATFCCGISFAWPSPELPRLNGNIDPENNPIPYNITVEEESWIASLLNLGTMAGPVFAGLMADNFGRKKTMMVCMIPVIISYATFSFASHVYYFYSARFLSGVGCGILLTVLPIYVGEISQDWNRGALSCFFAILVTSGNLYAFSVGPYVTVQTFNLMNIVPPIIFLILAYFIPESPYFYVDKGLNSMAVRALRAIRYNEDVPAEMVEIKKNIDESRKKEGKITDILQSKGLVKGLLITVGLMFIQQFTGISFILVYMQTIFHASGSKLSPEMSVIFVGIIQVLICMCVSLVVDKWGRRVLLLISIVGCGVFQMLLGLYFYYKNKGDNIDDIFWLPVASIIGYIVTFNIGIGPLPITLVGELFPSNVKAKACSLTIIVGFLLAFGVTKLFPTALLYLGMANSFWSFSVCCIIGFIYIWIIVPETKGKSLYEIQVLLNGKK